MGLAWISRCRSKEPVAAAGWMTLSCPAPLTPDDALDMSALATLLGRVGKEIHRAPNRVRAAMNNFMIAVGSYVRPLSGKAVAAARAIGEVPVDAGGTVQDPYAPE